MSDSQPITWRKSSRSDDQGGDCVEIAQRYGSIAVRDSKNPDAPAHTFTRAAFKALTREINAGQHDV